MIKNNDWFATLLFNPDKDINNLKVAGITPENTGLKDREAYINIPEVKEVFKTQDGQFDSKAFNQYYDSALKIYNKFVADDVNEHLFADYVYSPLNLWRDNDEKVSTPEFKVVKVANPTLKSIGVSSLFGEGPDARSMREAAQTQKVYNWETKQFEDWTPNDDDKRGIIDFWKAPTLVEATWDEDGTHIENGREVKHYKGMQKLNADGMPYYETLGNRDVTTKSTLHLSDTLTVDGSYWNDYDVFDNDGLDKSVTGTTMNIIANVAPLFIPYIGPIYKWSTIALGLGKALGAFGKSGVDLFTDEKPKLWQYFNRLDAFTSRLDQSTSDYGSEHPFSWEGIGNIIKDSVKQLYQQREVAKLPRYLGLGRAKLSEDFINANNKTYLGKFGKTFEEALADGDVDKTFLNTFIKKSSEETGRIMSRFNKLSRDLSSMYMAVTQSADVYQTMKQADFSPEYTAIGMVASLVGFKKIMDSELGDVALSGLGLDDTKLATNKFLKDYLKDIKNIIGESDITTKAGKFAAIKKVSDFINNGVQTISKSPLLLSAAKEGMEEVSEEMLQDGILGLLTAVDNVFFDGTDANYVPWENNMAARYGSALLGGIIGGSIFKGVEMGEARVAELKSGKITHALPKSVLQDLETVIRNGGANEAIQVVDKWIKSGRIASTDLSLDVNTDLSTNDQTVFKVARDRESSQNNIIGEYLKNYIQSLDRIINEDGLGLTDAQVINLALDKDTKLTELAKSGIDKDILSDFTEMLNNLVTLKSELNATQDGQSDKISTLNSKITEAQNKIKGFLDGGSKAKYVEEMLFTLNRSVNSGYMTADVSMYAASKGKNYLSMSDEERKAIGEDYEKLKKNNREFRRYAYNMYVKTKEIIQPHLNNLATAAGQESIQYSKFVREQVDALNQELGELSTDEISKYKEEFLNTLVGDKSIDEVIEERGLNPLNYKLTETQKKDLFNAYVESMPEYQEKLEIRTNEKRLIKAAQNLELGIDKDVYLRSDQNKAAELAKFGQLVDVLTQAKSQFGFIDNQTAGKVRNIIDYYNNLNVTDKISKLTLKEAFDILGDKIVLTSRVTTAIPVIEANAMPLFEPEMVEETSIERVEILPGRYNYVINYKLKEGAAEEIQQNFEDFVDENGDLETEDGVSISLDSVVQSGTYSDNISPEETKDLIVSEVNKSGNLNYYTNLDDDSNSDLAKKLFKDDLYNDRIALVKNANTLLDTVRDNIVLDALDSISKLLSGESITNLLKTEEANYKSLSGIDDYTINNNLTEQQLRTLHDSINILHSLLLSSIDDIGNLSGIESSAFSFSKILNDAKRKAGLPEDVILDSQTVISMLGDLVDLGVKVNYLLGLHEYNVGNKIQNSKKTNTNLNSMLALMLGTNKGLPKLEYIDDSGTHNFLDFGDLVSSEDAARLQEIFDTGSIKEDDYKFTVETLYKVKKAIYNKYQGLSTEAKDGLMAKLASDTYLAKDYSHETDIKRNSDLKDISNEFICAYIYKNMVDDPEDFMTKFKTVLLNNSDTYAPFAGQMMDIEFNWAMLHHSEEINKYLSNVVHLSSNEMIKNDYNFIPNTVFNLGDPGSGKTTAVAWFSNEMIKLENPEVKVWCTAPKKGMASKLAKLLGYDANYSKDELFNTLLTDSGKNKYQSIKAFFEENKKADGLLEPGSVSKLNVNYFNSDDFIAEVPDVIFIDEVTHFNYMETTLLGNIKSKSGKTPKIIALGDPNQKGAEDLDKTDVNGAQGIIFKSPNLNMSVRADNTTKQDNLYKMSTILKRVLASKNAAVSNRVKFDPRPFIKSIQEDMKIKFFEDGNELHGEKVITQLDENTVRTLVSNLGEGEKLALITDKNSGKNIDLFNSLDKDKVVIVNEDHVQGSEYKYSIIDVDWIPIKANTNEDVFTSELRRAYTLLTRSSVGTIVIDPDGTSIFKNNEATTVSRRVEIDKNDVLEYSKFVLSALTTVETPEVVVPNVDTPIPTVVEVTPAEVATAKNNLSSNLNTDESLGKDNEFLNKNLTVHSGFYFIGNTDEDINGLENNGQSENENKIGLVNLKSLLLNNHSRIEELINSGNNEVLAPIYSTFRNKYFPNASPEESVRSFNNAILNGNLAIKVKRAEAGDIPYNRPETDDFKHFTIGTTITKLVYRIPIGDNKTWDITMGLITKPSDMQTDVQAEVNRRMELTSRDGSVQYINIKKDANLNIRGIDIRPGLDLNGNPIDPKRNPKSGSRETRLEALAEFTVSKLKLTHPELNISDPYVLTEEMPSASSIRTDPFFIRKGQTVVLASRDKFLSSADMHRKFVEYIKNPNRESLDGITPIWVTPVGVSNEEFMRLWVYLYQGNTGPFKKMNHQYLGGYMQGPRFLNILIGMKNYLSNPADYRPNNTRSQSYWPNKERLNQIFTGDTNKIPSTEELKPYLNVLNEKIFEPLRGTISVKNNNQIDLPVDYKKLTPSQLGMTKEQVATLKEAAKKVANEINPMMTALESLKDTDPAFNKVFEALQKVNASKSILSMGMLELFESGALPPVLMGANIVDTVAKTYRHNDDFKKVMDAALNTSSQFVGGIQLNSINSVDGVVSNSGLLNSALSDSELYVDQYVGNPRFYIDYSNLELDTQTTEQEEAPVEVVQESKSTDFNTELLNGIENSLSLSDNSSKDLILDIYKTQLLPEISALIAASPDIQTSQRIINEYFETNVNNGAMYNEDGKLLRIFPPMRVEQDGTLSISSDARDAKAIFFNRGSDLSKSIQVTAKKRISEATIRSFGKPDSIGNYIKFLSPRFFALNLNGNIYTGTLNLTSGKTMFKLLSPKADQHIELVDKHKDIISKLPVYTKC